MQEQLIRQERKRILDEYARSGSLSADTVISPDLLALAADGDDDEDDVADVKKIQIIAAKATSNRQKKATPAAAVTAAPTPNGAKKGSRHR